MVTWPPTEMRRVTPNNAARYEWVGGAGRIPLAGVRLLQGTTAELVHQAAQNRALFTRLVPGEPDVALPAHVSPPLVIAGNLAPDEPVLLRDISSLMMSHLGRSPLLS